MHVYACLLLCFISMFACLDLGFAVLCALRGLVLVDLWGHLLVWLHPSLLWIVWMWPLVRYTFMVLVCLMHILSPLCALLCLPCLLYATRLAFIASLHACLHVHAWVCVSSILQFHGTMNTWSKPTFILLGHPLLFDNMFVCPYLALLLIACLLACFPSTCFFTCLLACFLCHCMYTLGAWTLGVRVWPPRHKKNGQGCKQEDISPQRAMFSRLGGLASRSGYIFLPLP